MKFPGGEGVRTVMTRHIRTREGEDKLFSRGWVRAWARTVAFVCLAAMGTAACVSTQVEPHSADGEPLALTEDEQVLWDSANYVESKLSEHQASFDGRAEAEEYLQDIVERLVPEFFTEDPRRVRSYVLVAQSPNAFVLPNGAIYVTSGMLVLLENEAQLATILGHEFSHFQYRHHLRQERQEESARRAGVVFGVFLAGLTGAAGGSVDSNMTSSAADLWTRVSAGGYSRDLEREADRMGLIAVLGAGYEPSQTGRAFELLRQSSEKEGFEHQGLFASHPELTERIENYRQFLKTPEMQSLASGHRVGEEQYLNQVSAVMLPHAELQIRLHRADEARETLARYRKAAGIDAKATFLLGEAFRYESEGKGGQKLLSAAEHYRRAIELDPDCIDCYRELGLVYRTMDEHALSRKFLTKYVELAPDRPDVLIIKSFFKQPDE